MGERTQNADPVTTCTLHCGARCCRYITVSVPAPRSHADWDEFRWWLAHQGTMLTKDDDGWMLHVQTPCGNLGPGNLCRVYENRMTACSEYEFHTCEYHVDVPFDLELKTEEDLAAHLEKKRLKRGRAVARAIRRAHRRGV